MGELFPLEEVRQEVIAELNSFSPVMLRAISNEIKMRRNPMVYELRNGTFTKDQLLAMDKDVANPPQLSQEEVIACYRFVDKLKISEMTGVESWISSRQQRWTGYDEG